MFCRQYITVAGKDQISCRRDDLIAGIVHLIISPGHFSFAGALKSPGKSCFFTSLALKKIIGAFLPHFHFPRLRPLPRNNHFQCFAIPLFISSGCSKPLSISSLSFFIIKSTAPTSLQLSFSITIVFGVHPVSAPPASTHRSWPPLQDLARLSLLHHSSALDFLHQRRRVQLAASLKDCPAPNITHLAVYSPPASTIRFQIGIFSP
ncbi:hypothetical protein AAC387_Pa08g0199 [Persea americana]